MHISINFLQNTYAHAMLAVQFVILRCQEDEDFMRHYINRLKQVNKNKNLFL